MKPLRDAKSRLSPLLDAGERELLTLAMFEDVLEACLAQPTWEVWVVSRDVTVLDVAGGRGAAPVVEEGTSLLAAIRQAERMLPRSGDELAVVLADLPALEPDALAAALAVAGPVVAAPAASDGGTNLLIRRPPTVIPARFGTASFAKHRWAARRKRLDVAEVRDPALAFDLDRPEDVARLMLEAPRGRTYAACQEMGLGARLRMLDDTGRTAAEEAHG